MLLYASARLLHKKDGLNIKRENFPPYFIHLARVLEVMQVPSSCRDRSSASTRIEATDFSDIFRWYCGMGEGEGMGV